MADTDLTGLSEINALLGAGTEYEGKLVFQGRVRVDGRFSGEIHGNDVLILGATADVRADVHVGALIVLGGTLRGNVVARRLVELHAPGAVHGDIETPQLFIDKGATFTGSCTMGSGPAEVHPLEPPWAQRQAPRRPLGRNSAPKWPTATSEDMANDDSPFLRAPNDEGAPVTDAPFPGSRT
jgi:cytoskeletal protein CcmA (bactofilin family)